MRGSLVESGIPRKQDRGQLFTQSLLVLECPAFDTIAVAFPLREIFLALTKLYHVAKGLQSPFVSTITENTLIFSPQHT